MILTDVSLGKTLLAEQFQRWSWMSRETGSRGMGKTNKGAGVASSSADAPCVIIVQPASHSYYHSLHPVQHCSAPVSYSYYYSIIVHHPVTCWTELESNAHRIHTILKIHDMFWTRRIMMVHPILQHRSQYNYNFALRQFLRKINCWVFSTIYSRFTLLSHKTFFSK